MKDLILKALKPVLKFIAPIGLPKRKFNGKDYDVVIENLQVGDILLTKTNYELTNLFNPIDLAHAAIVVDVGEGLKVVEALGKGVVITHLFDFFRRKDLVHLYRFKEFKDIHPVDISRKALNYVGYAYDYNFKHEAKREKRNVKLYCYELVIRVIQDVLPDREFLTSTMFRGVPFLSHDYYSHDTIIDDNRFKLVYDSKGD